MRICEKELKVTPCQSEAANSRVCSFPWSLCTRWGRQRVKILKRLLNIQNPRVGGDGGRRKKLQRGKVEERKEGEERMEGCEEKEEGRKGLVRTFQRYDYASALGAMLNPILRTGRS